MTTMRSVALASRETLASCRSWRDFRNVETLCRRDGAATSSVVFKSEPWSGIQCRSEGVRGVCVRTTTRAAVGSRVSTETIDITEFVIMRKEMLDKSNSNREFKVVEVDSTGQKDWHSATVSKVEDVATGVRCITLTAECSREFVSLEKAYTKPGQLVQVMVDDKTPCSVPASSPPFSNDVNAPVLYKIRGDIPAGTTKVPQFSLSVQAPVDLHVTEADTPALFNVSEGTELQLGPFGTTGLDMRPIMFIARFPTLLIFAQGRGISVARAILECKEADMGSLNLALREDIRLFYSAPKPSFLAYKNRFQKWENHKVKVRAAVHNTDGEKWEGHVGSFTTLWVEDDVEYDPLTTGAIVCVEESERESLKILLADAGIPEQQIVIWEV